MARRPSDLHRELVAQERARAREARAARRFYVLPYRPDGRYEAGQAVTIYKSERAAAAYIARAVAQNLSTERWRADQLVVRSSDIVSAG